MPASDHAAHAEVWAVLAQYWVDTWYDDGQLNDFALRLSRTDLTLDEMDTVAKREVCGAFATFTFAVFASAGMALPDWYYPEDEAIRKVSEWRSRPRLVSWLNPFWIVGYIMALGYLWKSWPRLRAKVEALRAAT